MALFTGIFAALAGCSDASGNAWSGDDASVQTEINVNPANHDEALEALTRIDALMSADQDDPVAHAALAKLRPRLDQLNHLIARVEAKSGHIVSFYEPEPGSISVSERGPADVTGPLNDSRLRDLSAVDLYAALSAGALPTALLEAQERAEVAAALSYDPNVKAEVARESVLTSSVAARELAVKADGVGQSRQALTAEDGQFFRDNYCWRSGNSNHCLPDWYNGGWFARTAQTSFLRVAPFQGNVSIRMTYQGSAKFTDPVFQGENLGWRYFSSTYGSVLGPQYNQRHHRWDILNATGDGFHWTVAFMWQCGAIQPCQEWPI
jgi:hypothetical protein